MPARRNTIVQTVLPEGSGSLALTRIVGCESFRAQDTRHIDRRDVNAFESCLGHAMLDTDSIENTCDIGL